MSSRILVPLDGSALAEQALGYAEHLAEATSARLFLSRVLPVYLIQPAESDLDRAEQARAYLRGVADGLWERGRQVETTTPWGDPAHVIVEQARSEGASMSVMGTHGRAGLARVVLGSVVTGTLRRTDVPLMLIRPDAARLHGPQERVASGAVT
jgi:nucleotide-binding universal stress UspA family protein